MARSRSGGRRSAVGRAISAPASRARPSLTGPIQSSGIILKGLVEDAERLLELARLARGRVPEGSRAEHRLLAASQLLGQLLLQDVERKADGEVSIRRGTSGERIPSVHDPEIRHGRKSQTVRFDGHKLGLAVDTEAQLITAVDIIAGSAKDDEGALTLVSESAVATGLEVEQV